MKSNEKIKESINQDDEYKYGENNDSPENKTQSKQWKLNSSFKQEEVKDSNEKEENDNIKEENKDENYNEAVYEDI